MRQDRDVLDALQADLGELTALHAPSGSEQPVIARLRDLFTPLVDTVAVDHMGNLTATREGPQAAPHIVVSAHADEIGALVARIEPEGFLRLLPLHGQPHSGSRHATVAVPQISPLPCGDQRAQMPA